MSDKKLSEELRDMEKRRDDLWDVPLGQWADLAAGLEMERYRLSALLDTYRNMRYRTFIEGVGVVEGLRDDIGRITENERLRRAFEEYAVHFEDCTECNAEAALYVLRDAIKGLTIIQLPRVDDDDRQKA